jgi:BASS family bile acid:Na+ symporter
MDLLDHVLRRMGRHATALLPFSLLVGVVFQDLAAAFRPLVAPLAVLLLMLALVRTDWPRVRALLARPALALGLSAALLAAVPLVVWPIWSLFPIWPGLIAALCLSAIAPTVISAATTATFLRLDNSLALLIALITNFAVPSTCRSASARSASGCWRSSCWR